METKLKEIAGKFRLEGIIKDVAPLGEGFINDTYIIEMQKATPRYILQRKNKRVFSPVPAMMENIEIVCSHIKQKVAETGGDPLRQAMTIIRTNDGKLYYEDKKMNSGR